MVASAKEGGGIKKDSEIIVPVNAIKFENARCSQKIPAAPAPTGAAHICGKSAGNRRGNEEIGGEKQKHQKTSQGQQKTS